MQKQKKTLFFFSSVQNCVLNKVFIDQPRPLARASSWSRGMAPLKFCANVSWIFTEVPDLSRRIQAAAAAGFQAVEAAWILDSNLQELQRVKESAGVELVLLNTPPGESWLLVPNVPAGRGGSEGFLVVCRRPESRGSGSGSGSWQRGGV